MRDTIDWLETIGGSADLRRAQPEALLKALGGEELSQHLISAIQADDASALSAEFGDLLMRVNLDPQTPGHEEEPDEDDEDEEDDDEQSLRQNQRSLAGQHR